SAPSASSRNRVRRYRSSLRVRTSSPRKTELAVPNSISSCVLREPLPVEIHAMAVPCRRERLAVLQHQRMLDEAVEAETVRFEIGTVRTGREQRHGHVMRAVAGDGKIEGLREPCDLHEGGDSAAIGHVRLGIGHGAGGDIVLEFPERTQIL